MRRALLTTLTLLVLPASASAAPPWSDPRPLGPSGTVLDDPRLTFGTTGAEQSSWRLFAGGRRRLALGPDGRLVTSALPSPVAYGTTRVLHLREREGVLGVSYGRTGGSIGRLRAIARLDVSRSSAFGGPVLDADARGNAVIAWIDPLDGGARRPVKVVRRRAGGSFGHVETIRGTGRASSVAAAAGDGRAIVAWEREGVAAGRTVRRVEARVGEVAGGLRGLQDVGPSLGQSQIAAEVAGNGRATIAWQTRDLGEEANLEPELHAALASAGSFGIRSAQLVARGPGRQAPLNPPSLDSAPNGVTTLAWTTGGTFVGERVHFRAQAARTDRSGRFGDVRDLGPGAAGRVAVRAEDAEEVVPVIEDAGFDTPGRLLALRRPALAAAFTGQEVAPLAISEAAAGFAGHDGPAVVLFGRPAGGRTVQAARSQREG